MTLRNDLQHRSDIQCQLQADNTSEISTLLHNKISKVFSIASIELQCTWGQHLDFSGSFAAHPIVQVATTAELHDKVD